MRGFMTGANPIEPESGPGCCRGSASSSSRVFSARLTTSKPLLESSKRGAQYRKPKRVARSWCSATIVGMVDREQDGQNLWSSIMDTGSNCFHDYGDLRTMRRA